MNILSALEGITLLLIFGIGMIVLVLLKGRAEHGVDGFLVADRKIGLWQGAFSTAVSWVWAPAIFICSLQAYKNGLPGVMWFTLPNVVCFFVFAPVAIKLRRKVPNGYTVPEYIYQRFNKNKATHLIFLGVFLGYQMGAMLINALAGGSLLHAVSGIDIHFAIISMTAIALTYSLIRGLKASVRTDVIQMAMLIVIALIIVPACFFKTGGFPTLNEGLGGVAGEYDSLLNPWLAFTLGIPMTLSLLAGPFGDQMFYQRTFAIEEKHVVRSFVYAGFIFAIVPITLSLLGFMGAGMVRQGLLEVADPQLVGPLVVAAALPKAALYAFCLMAFAGLCSTMDSSMCALSSLGGIDIYRRYINPNASGDNVLRFSRWFMTGMAMFSTGFALLEPKMMWVFLIYGSIVSAGMFPIIFSITSKRLGAKAAGLAVGLSFFLATPLSAYANISEDPVLVVIASLLSVLIGLAICAFSIFFDFRFSISLRKERPSELNAFSA